MKKLLNSFLATVLLATTASAASQIGCLSDGQQLYGRTIVLDANGNGVNAADVNQFKYSVKVENYEITELKFLILFYWRKQHLLVRSLILIQSMQRT